LGWVELEGVVVGVRRDDAQSRVKSGCLTDKWFVGLELSNQCMVGLRCVEAKAGRDGTLRIEFDECTVFTLSSDGIGEVD